MENSVQLKTLIGSFLVVTLAACGGGGGGGGGGDGGSSHVAVTGKLANGNPIVACIDSPGTVTPGTASEAAMRDDLLSYYGVWMAREIGYSYAVSGNSSASCISKFGAGATIISKSTYDSTVKGKGEYLYWPNSVNGNQVMDASKDLFRVRSADQKFVDANGVVVSGVSLVRGDDLLVMVNGNSVGKVIYTSDGSGKQVAALVCNGTSGSAMDFTFSDGVWKATPCSS